MFTAADHRYMAQALRLARRGLRSTRPNPAVGCVIVRDDTIVGEGWHAKAGGPHAEVVALRAAGRQANGATVYVTLEPCSHQGRTGPCVGALQEAGVTSVVAAMQDPYKEVSGRGFAALRAANIDVRSGLMERAARELNRGYLSRVERARPHVKLKVAASMDGASAMSSGESQWITGPEARRDVQRLRAQVGAIMTGVGTVLADDPSLTVRDETLDVEQPHRVIVDTDLRTPVTAKVLGTSGKTLIYAARDGNAQALRSAGAEVIVAARNEGGVACADVLADLAAREVNDVLVECGPTLAGSLLSERLVDELVVYIAPHIMGSETRRLFATPSWQSLSDRSDLDIQDVRMVGRDMRVTAALAGSTSRA